MNTNKTIIDTFKEQVSLNQETIAVVCEQECISYRELDEKSTLWAKSLISLGVKKGSFIGLMMTRSVDMITAILAVLKSGASYMPISLDQPVARTNFMLKQSKCEFVLTNNQDFSASFDEQLVVSTKDLENFDECRDKIDLPLVPKDSVAYCIFTSGSTGKPKGVLMGQHSVINLVKGLKERVYGSYGDKTLNVALLASFVFDASVQQIFGALLQGHSLHIINEESRKDGAELLSFYNKNNIDVSDGTPTHLRLLVNACDKNASLKSLTSWILAGELLSKELVKTFFSKLGKDTQIYNFYGPTETCVDSTSFKIDPDNLNEYASIPIGKPLPNERVYVTDNYGRILPVGIAGELCIAGDGLAQGYLGDESLTLEKFDPDWIPSEDRVYRTGDIVRWLSDGNLEFVGRKDDQVKLRGYRIEMAEIEYQLHTYEGVTGSVVLVKEVEGERHLVAYYLCKDTIEVASLRKHLSEHLPDYMIPSFYVQVPEFPLTVNGKINKKVLPAPIIDREQVYIAPESNIEHKLVEIWADVLKINPEVIGVNSSFFNFGGDSLRMIFLMNSINKEFVVKISPKDFMVNPTIKYLTELISKSTTVSHSSIPVSEQKAYYPLSSSQKRMYYLYECDKDSLAYNVPVVATLNWALERDKFQKAFETLIQRHEVLRTVFEFVGGELVQRILPEVEFSISTLEKDEDLQGTLKSFVRPFDLSQSPLLRVGLKHISNEEHLLVIDCHHIASDEITSAILLNELISLYNGESLADLRIQYKDFAIWEQGEEHQKKIAEQKEYWLNRFSGGTSTLELPYDYPRPKEFNVLGKNHTVELDKMYVDRLQAMAQAEGVTMYTLFLALYNLLLYKLSNQKDIVIGTPVAGRSHIDLETMPGVFINTLAIRNSFKGDLTFKTFLHQVQQNNLLDLEHQLYPYGDLVDALNVERTSGRNTLFDVFLNYQSINGNFVSGNSGLQIELYEDLFSQAKFDLIFTVLNFGNRLKLNFTFRDELFKEDTIARFMSYLGSIMDQVLIDHNTLLDDIDILSREEVDQLLIEFNDTSTVYEKDNSLIELFLSQVKNSPDKTALVFEEESLTYGELDKRSTQLARYINKKDKTKSSLIGICLDRSIDMIIGILGILKSGRGYVPIDITYPTNRINHILKDSEVGLVITKGKTLELFKEIEKILLDKEKGLINEESARKISSKIKSNDPAYVIYTSGSTGKPKGVLVSHQNVTKLVTETGPVSVKSTDRVLQWSNIAFDGSVFDIFCSLLNGATLYLIDKKSASDLKILSTVIRENKISIAFITTALFNVFVDTEIEGLSPLRKLLFGGERVSLKHVQKAYDVLGSGKMIHCYGPTETTVYATYYPIDERPIHNVPIGKPLSNTKAYILDSSDKLCGMGIVGEIHIGGDGVAMGYLKDEEITTTKFIDNPYETGSCLYKTGDLAKWLPNGNLEFIGRKDSQIKLRGYRIELSEIEFQLNTLDKVTGSFTVIKELEGIKQLVVYYTSEIALDISEIKTYLSALLPDYMVPSHYVHLQQFPLTANGKINQNELPEPEIVREEGYIAPSSDTEHKLVQIWTNILKINPEVIGVDSSFFDFGGDSLKMIYLINSINKEFEVKISLKQIITSPTIKYLCQLILESQKVNHVSIPVSVSRPYYPLSSSQKRMYYMYEYDKESIAYNLPVALTLRGALDIQRLETAFCKLIQQHENLRTVFEFVDLDLVQRILPEVAFSLQSLKKSKDINETIRNFIKPFDLSQSPLLRAGIIYISEKEHILVMDCHHIISDGVTTNILIADLIALYNGEELSTPKIQYKDYVMWQLEVPEKASINFQKAYWMNEFSENPVSLELPTDYPRYENTKKPGGKVQLLLDNEKTKKLISLAKDENTTLFSVLLTIYNLLLSKLSSQEDIVVGTSISGRSHADLDNIAGLFMNVLALRNYPEGDKRFSTFLKEVSQRAFTAFENQDYAYDDLVAALNKDNEPNRYPLFNVMFEYFNFDKADLKGSDLSVEKFNYDYNIAKFDMTLRVCEFESGLEINLEYNTDIFDKSSIERFTAYFEKLIDEVLIQPDSEIRSINMLPESEKDLLINGFNNTSYSFEKNRSLVSIFEKNVALYPDRVAVSFEGEVLTYKELDNKSNKVANYLISEGVIPNVVGLLIDRSIDMIVGIWGALKVGAGYLPLDPNLPEQRIRYMLDQSKATFLLSHDRYLEAYSAYLPVQSIDSTKINSQSTDKVAFETELADLAYCIFTSGSTGRPKGVMISHSNVINLVDGLGARVYKPYESKVLRVALLASFAFDASVQQIFGALLQGHSLYITNDESRKDGIKLQSFFNDNNIDISDGTPTHLRLLLNSLNQKSELKSLSSWLLAGEVLPKDLVRTFYDKLGEGVQLYNLYGPTETCVDSTSFKIDPKQLNDLKTIPIGKPLPNERVYVTNNYGELVPIGVIGELCIAGDGLARRYVGDQSLTTEKFNSQWIPLEDCVYRTGDMVRWLPDGNLEFHGRKDNQVKIRGYRIELGEIAEQLNAHPKIKHSIVLLKESEGEKHVVAYYKASDNLEISELRDYLGVYLPDYMIPYYYVHVKEFGLTVNGKIDYKALPEFRVDQKKQYVAPSNDIERKLAGIYGQILKLDFSGIGSNSNFIELGGHSLKMVFLANSIKKEFEVKISLKEIMENPTITKLSALIANSAKVDHSEIPVSGPMEFYPLSSSQKRMYFAHQYDKKSISYNAPIAATFKGVLSIDKLENSFSELIKRHEALRTVFISVEGNLLQRILPEIEFSIEYLKRGVDLDTTILEFVKPFDLEKGPLLRVGVIELSKYEHVVVVDCHHIISDEVTHNILIKDFVSIYKGENLPKLRIQYKDYVIWQNQEEQQIEIKKQKAYWLNKFSEEVPTLELPYDYPRSSRDNDKGGNLLVKLDQSKIIQLKKIAQSEGLTLYNLFLAMYNILLYKLSNQQDIVVGTPVAARPHKDLESIMGVFINTLPIRNRIHSDMTFKEFVKQVQNGSVMDLDYQLYPYEDLIDELNLERDLSRNPLFDVSFNFMKQDLSVLDIPDVNVEPYPIEHNASKFDLSMIVMEQENEINIHLEYAKLLFHEKTIKRFIKYFHKIIDAVCASEEVKISGIEILEEKESQLLNSFSPMNNSYQEESTIINVFEKQVKATPLAIALKYGDVSYSYDDLNQKVNQLARRLQSEFGVSKGEIVGVLQPKSDAAVLSILAILKLGAVYLPIDTNYPVERINYIIENSGLRALITDNKSCSAKISVDCQINYETVIFDQEEETNLNINISSKDLAYVIYTSGSTGKPKGVMIEHGSNVNMSTDIVKQLNVNDRDTILWFASIAFDASVYEIMMALYSGATLVIPEDGVINDITRFCSLISESRTTLVTLPPSYLETLPLEKLKSLRIITTAGEAANAKKAVEVIKNGIRYFNAYGPTECAVCASTYEVFKDDENLTNIPIGKPIVNTEMVILDNDLKKVPIGVKGIIYVAGKGLARGYLNNPELTNKSFITVPGDSDKRYYNTGDIGEWTSNGLILFHGRKDNQIKLRGFRIELGEIEGALSSIDGVRNSHVAVRQSDGREKELVGYVILDGNLDKTLIEEKLSRLLPEYMIPRSWVKLDKFPLTINGKIDTKELLKHEVIGKKDYISPSNDVEKMLVQIWSETLRIDEDKISVLDDFFDLGGNSLSAIRLITGINKNYGIQLELQEVFKLKTIRKLSELIDLNVWVINDDKKEMEYSETVI